MKTNFVLPVLFLMSLSLSSSQGSSFQQTWTVVWRVDTKGAELLGLDKETMKSEYKQDPEGMGWN